MSWMVKRIQEDDFGCEERPEETDLKLKICAIFDAYIMWEYSKVKQIPYN